MPTKANIIPLGEVQGQRLSISNFDVDILQAHTTDYTVNYQQAMACAGAQQGRLHFPPVPNGYLLTQTLDLYPHTHISGVWGGGPWAGVYNPGTVFKWAGAGTTGMPILRARGVSGLHIEGIAINGMSVGDNIGLLIDSVNAPPTSHVSIKRCSVSNVGYPLYAGGTVVTNGIGTPLVAGSSLIGLSGVGFQVGSGGQYQCDTTWFTECAAYFCGTGLLLNSNNSAQAGCYNEGTFGQCLIGLRILFTGALFQMHNVAGSLLDVENLECAFVSIDGLHGPLSFDNITAEAGFGCSLRVSAGIQGLVTAIRMSGWQTGHKVAIRSQRRLISQGNVYIGDFEMSGNDVVVSTDQDQFTDPKDQGLVPFTCGPVNGTMGVVSGSNAATYNAGSSGYSAVTIQNVFSRGSIVFDLLGIGSLGDIVLWKGLTAYALGKLVINSANHVFKVTTAGTSGAYGTTYVQPAWNNASGGTTTDGSVVWTEQGVVAVYTMTWTGFDTLQIQDNVTSAGYVGATNAAASFCVFAVPARNFIQTGTPTTLLNRTPLNDSAMQGFATNSNNTMPLRLRGLPGGDVNPALALANASQLQEWQIIFPGTGGSLPGGLLFRDVKNNTYPLRIFPGAATGALDITTSGISSSLPAVVPQYNDDSAGNLPATWPTGFYSGKVNAISTFPPNTHGTVEGYSDQTVATGQYSWQVYRSYVAAPAITWIRWQANATTWGPWRDIREPASYTFATLPTATEYPSAMPNGSAIVYCSNAKNILDDAVIAGSVAVTGGHGAMLAWVNGSWRVMC